MPYSKNRDIPGQEKASEQKHFHAFVGNDCTSMLTLSKDNDVLNKGKNIKDC